MPTVSLGEGNTPLVPSLRLAAKLGLRRLFFKLELCNPSGSYKDRFIAAHLSHMLSTGARACVATSSGNTGAALAAYCARYGLTCSIIVNQNAPAGKLAQMQAHGARVLRVQDFISSPDVTRQVFDTLERFSQQANAPLIVSAYRYCPQGMAGVESLGRELAIHPNLRHVFVPLGGGGLYSAVCRGLHGSPALVHAVQPEGCLTTVAAWLRGDDEIRPVESATAISGLAVPFDIDASLALRLLRENGGVAYPVSDNEVFQAQQLMLELEGIYTEPAGATALAGLLRALQSGQIQPGDDTICLVTGHGFKDPASITAAAARHPDTLLPPSALLATLQSSS
ncbi:MAG: pyridoxal-phosphate dependent enzyme [Bryobacterales bacterium]|nr:pyridoxal-phosphate dependent enzyme [Bryobacterales bacterium]